jgi:hypothetical protein
MQNHEHASNHSTAKKKSAYQDMLSVAIFKIPLHPKLRPAA